VTNARRVAATLLVGIAAFVVPGLIAAPAASAHPLGNFTVNRYSGLLLSPGRVRLTYVLDMAEIPTFQETPNIDTNGDGTVTGAERRAWADRTAPAMLQGLTLTVGGRPVALRIDSDSMRFRPGQGGLPILYFKALFTGPLASSGSLSYRDRNYADRIGWKEITAASLDGVAIVGSNVPARSVSRELTAYPVSLLSSPLKVGEASLSFRPGAGTGVASSDRSPRTVGGAPVASGGSFAALVNWRLTPVVLGLSLLLAFAFGALHALGPGHGKTITAAYLVGQEAKACQAVVAGVAVSFMHTLSVLTLGLVALVLFHSFPAERVYPWLGLLTGLVALGLGTTLLVVRVRARRRGLDPWHGHAHPEVREFRVAAPHRELAMVGASAGPGHDHAFGEAGLDHDHDGDGSGLAAGHDQAHPHHHERDHEHGSRPRAISRRGLAALAVSGGILPSPTALVVLTGAIAYHRLGYGLSLIVAFSLGLASALIAIAILALRARSLVSRKLGSRMGGLLPIASAAVIMGFGLFFLARGVGQIA